MKVGITFSTFDLLHAGHVQMLREAKENCDYLICGLQMDPSVDRPAAGEANAPRRAGVVVDPRNTASEKAVAIARGW